MDLDKDGILDIVSGSWPGELYWFKGLGKGRYDHPVKLKDTDQRHLRPGSASTVFACDWNGDGHLDLLMGNIEGHVLLSLGTGDGSLQFESPIKIQIAGQPIVANHGDSHPILADWDRDGLPDLLIGAGDGSVVWYRNVGSSTEPKFEKHRVLLKASENDMADEDAPIQNFKPGTRAKICAVDWNGDGWLDLLVGDFGMIRGKKPEMTEADMKKVQECQEKMAQIDAKMQPLQKEHLKLRTAPANEAMEAKKERLKKRKQIEEELQRLSAELRPSVEIVLKFQPSTSYRGNVWLLERIPPTVDRSDRR